MKEYQISYGYLSALSDLISSMDGRSTVETRHECAQLAHLLIEATLGDDSHRLYPPEEVITEFERFHHQRLLSENNELLDLRPMYKEERKPAPGFFETLGNEIVELFVGANKKGRQHENT